MPKGFDWSFGPGTSPIMGAINAAGTSASTSMVGSLVGVPWWGVLAVGVGGASTAAITAATSGSPGPVVAYRTMCWTAGTLWATITLSQYDPAHRLSTGPWSLTGLAILVALTLIWAAIGTVLRAAARRVTFRSVMRAFTHADERIREEWQDRIHRVGRIPTPNIVAGPERWPDGHGFTLEVDLGAGGYTWKHLSAQALASDAALDLGCGVEVSKGIKANRAIIRVATSDALATESPFPDDLSMATINNPMTIGWHRDGSPAQINLRWTSAVMAGQKGSGKTNTLHAATGALALCTDVVVFMVAIAKKGAAAEPWTRAYREGRTEYPIVDWVADTEEKAEAMCDVLDDLIDQRIEKHVARMRHADDDKVPVGYSDADDLFIPQVILIADEFAQLPSDLKRRIASIAETGRGSSVGTFGCSQRATSEHIPVSLKKQSSVRIGMRVSDTDELKYLFGWTKPIDVEDLVGEGYGILGDGQGEPRPMRVFRMTPSTIDRIAVECGKTGRRPGIEPGVLSPQAQKAYDERFNLDIEAKAAVGRSSRATSASVSQTAQNVHDVAARLRAQAEALKAQQNPPVSAEVAALEELWGLPAAEPERPAVEAPKSTARTPRDRALELLAEAGPAGSTAELIAAQLRAEGNRTTRQTVTGWFIEEIVKGTVEQPGGKNNPYVYKS
jgi:hypothetical protein